MGQGQWTGGQCGDAARICTRERFGGGDVGIGASGFERWPAALSSLTCHLFIPLFLKRSRLLTSRPLSSLTWRTGGQIVGNAIVSCAIRYWIMRTQTQRGLGFLSLDATFPPYANTKIRIIQTYQIILLSNSDPFKLTFEPAIYIY
jgi:hypothetical protein